MLTLLASGCPNHELAPLAACTRAVGRASVTQVPTYEVDLLFVIDDSASMSEEQDNLAAQLPELVRVLTTGRLDDETTFRPVDLHVGVISTDMGGLASKPCNNSKDGLLRSAETCGSATASAESYLSFVPGEGDNEIEPCAVKLGKEGCGLEQQLEAALKAVTPHDSDIEFASGRGDGHGNRENEGFLRKDSLLVVLTVTDEDDCSAPSLAFLADDPAEVEVACAFRPEQLYDVERYVKGLKALRKDRPERVLFAAITGVPPDLVEDPGAIDYDAILDDPRMTYRRALIEERIQLEPACEEAGVGIARPARRIVQVAREFGQNGLVQSICKRDYRGALSALLARIVELVGPACLPRKLTPDASGRVTCRVVETKALGETCVDKPARSAIAGEDDPTRCEVSQLSVHDGVPESGEGWYYDASDVDQRCPSGAGRISFTSQAMASPGARVDLECLEPVVSAGDGSRNEAAIGLACKSDQECAAHVDGERSDLKLLCDQRELTCEQSCESDAECDAPSVCDGSQSRPICVNPTCQ